MVVKGAFTHSHPTPIQPAAISIGRFGDRLKGSRRFRPRFAPGNRLGEGRPARLTKKSVAHAAYHLTLDGPRLREKARDVGCHFVFCTDDEPQLFRCRLFLLGFACAVQGSCAQSPFLPESDRRNPAIWRVVIGLHNLNDNSHTIKRRIKAINIHPNYMRDTYDNDIALITLVRSIKFSDYARPICLPATNLLTSQQYPCYISGWGNTKEKGENNLILQEAQVDIIPQNICNKPGWYAGTITLNMVCAGFPAGGIDSCQGDSGGPLSCYLPTTTKFYLIGITSFGYGCGRPRRPGVYVRTINYINWINNYLQSKIVTVELHCLLNFLIVWWTVFHIL